MTGSGRPVMADVAARAGVSVMTVSRVLNGFPGVTEATRSRVEEAVEALGYRANAAARVLAGGRSRTVGVVAVETQQFGPSQLLVGIEGAARATGHGTSFVTLPAPTTAELRAAIDHLRDGAHVEGIVVVAPVRPVLEAVASFAGEVPLVAVGGDPALPVPTVTIDQVAGARLATEHLLALGHDTVAHVTGPPAWIDADARRRGWASSLRAAGARSGRRLGGDWSAAGGYAAGRRLAVDPDVTAVFAANDQTALGLLRALAEAGRQVPGDVSLVGFDDTPESAYLLPPLTTVRQDFAEVGRRSVELLLAVVDGDDVDHHVVVEPELVVRASTGPRR